MSGPATGALEDTGFEVHASVVLERLGVPLSEGPRPVHDVPVLWGAEGYGVRGVLRDQVWFGSQMTDDVRALPSFSPSVEQVPWRQDLVWDVVPGSDALTLSREGTDERSESPPRDVGPTVEDNLHSVRKLRVYPGDIYLSSGPHPLGLGVTSRHVPDPPQGLGV